MLLNCIFPGRPGLASYGKGHGVWSVTFSLLGPRRQDRKVSFPQSTTTFLRAYDETVFQNCKTCLRYRLSTQAFIHRMNDEVCSLRVMSYVYICFDVALCQLSLPSVEI